MRIPYWIEGGFLGIGYVSVVLFIKGICSTDWCFADIFFPYLFQPLIIFDYLLSEKQISLIGENILWSVFLVWFVMGAIIGLIYGSFRKNTSRR